jgi:hypothetical protein
MAWLNEPDEVTIYVEGQAVEVRCHCERCGRG